MKLIKFLIVLLLMVGATNAQWKGFIAGQSDADVTETEAEAVDVLSDAIDGITSSEADALDVVGDAFDGITAAQADGLLNLGEGELTDTEVGYLNGAVPANTVASKAAILTSGVDLDLSDDMTMSSATPQISLGDTDVDLDADFDSSAVIIEANGTPSITIFGDDGAADTGIITIGTNDDLQFNSFTTVDIDGASTATSYTADAGIVATTTVTTPSVLNTQDVGAVEGNGVVAVEYGDGANHVTVLTLTATVLGTPDPGNNLAFGDTIYVFPAGVQIIDFIDVNVSLQGVTQTDDQPELGLGSVMAAGVQATLGAAGATMEDYWEGTAVADVNGTALNGGPKGATAGIFTGIALNGTAAVKNLCLNVADGWHASITSTLTASGTVAIRWTTLR